jgi:3-oxoacyl-[acyl-carrier protein] reductase
MNASSQRLAGRTALVVGGARGIGGGIAKRFAAEGARVVIADTEVEAGVAFAASLGGSDKARFIETDISQKADAERAVAEVDALRRLDIVVQNAGIYPWTLIENIEPDEWDAVMGVNLRGTYLVARAALPAMKAKSYGRMIFTSSITGPRVTSPGHGHYSASKAGINGFIKAAALEFAGYGITVNGIEPGNILTEGMKARRSAAFIKGMEDSIPLGRLGTPEDIANAAFLPGVGGRRLYHRHDHRRRWRPDLAGEQGFSIVSHVVGSTDFFGAV